MKTLFFCFLTLFYLQQCKAQKAVVANFKQNIAYIGIPNHLGVLVEGYKWDEINVSTDNGKIEKYEEDRSYLYYPSNKGLSIIVLRSKDGDTLGIAEFRVKPIPNPTPKLNSKSDGEVRKTLLLVIPGIYCQLDNFDFDIKFRICGYSVALYKNDSSFYIKSNIDGPLFTEELKHELKKTKHDDKLMFFGITAQAPDNIIRELSPMEFTITE